MRKSDLRKYLSGGLLFLVLSTAIFVWYRRLHGKDQPILAKGGESLELNKLDTGPFYLQNDPRPSEAAKSVLPLPDAPSAV